MGVISVLLILVTASCTVGTQMLLKGVGESVALIVPSVSLYNMGKLILFAATQPKIIFAIILQATGFMFWIVVISREHAGAALGLGGASVYLLTALVEWLIFDVRLGVIKLVALFLVSMGAFLLANVTS
jgi:hypothetical protein